MNQGATGWKVKVPWHESPLEPLGMSDSKGLKMFLKSWDLYSTDSGGGKEG